MARVPITVMGFQCERCEYQWIPRDIEQEPRFCPKCKSPYWNKPRRKDTPMTYEAFRDTIKKILATAPSPLTWTEIRTTAKLPQMFPNNQWVRRLESDISLIRPRDKHGIIRWGIASGDNHAESRTTEAAEPVR